MMDTNVKTMSGSYNRMFLVLLLMVLVVGGFIPMSHVNAAQLRAGVAKVDITDTTAGPVNDRLYVRALLLNAGETTAVIITVDAVAIGEIGHISNNYLGSVRSQIENELQIKPGNVLINASHCHGVVCSDIDRRTFQAVKEASLNMVPVNVGAGIGYEDRIMENRRLKLKNGQEADVRHAYSLVPDEEVAGVGPVDPEIGIFRLDRKDGRTLAVVYNFAIHPIQGVPGGGNTADITGFASQVIEDNLGKGTIALFLQGCAGDINPVWYKDVNHPRDAEPLGNMLGLSTLQALKKIDSKRDNRLKIINEVIKLPRADYAQRIFSMEIEQEKLDYILRTEKEIHRMDTVIRQLLDLSRPSAVDSSVVSIHEVIDDIANVLNVQPLMSNIELTLSLEAQSDQVLADPNQLRQVFLNLAINAADAIAADREEKQGKLEIMSEVIGKNLASKKHFMKSIEIRFIDNGSGISQKILDNIFDPFFTTKAPGQGTGLGLYVCFMIVDSLGGNIQAHSAEGQGMTMTITLPLAE